MFAYFIRGTKSRSTADPDGMYEESLIVSKIPPSRDHEGDFKVSVLAQGCAAFCPIILKEDCMIICNCFQRMEIKAHGVH